MCGRYLIKPNSKTHKLFSSHYKQLNISNEITPTQLVPIIISQNQRLKGTLMYWGIEQHSKLIINAKAETINEKSTFKQLIKSHRCIIPSNGFYEWDEAKNRYRFNTEEETTYMAGIYTFINHQPHFVIITTKANPSMSSIHHRMPLILTRTQIEDWLNDEKIAQQLLHQIPPLLAKTLDETKSYTQLNLL